MPSLLWLYLFSTSVLSVVTTQSFCYDPRNKRRKKRKRNKEESSDDSSDPEFDEYFDELKKEEKGKFV